MDRSKLTENLETGLYESIEGRVYICCQYHPTEPNWIDVTGEKWFTSYSGRNTQIDWMAIKLPGSLKAAFKTVLLSRMKTKAPSYLVRIDTLLKNFVKTARHCNIEFNPDFEFISASDWLVLWKNLSNDHRSILRGLYEELARKGLAGASYEISLQMKTWHCGRESQILRVVLDWDKTQGSLLSAEWEVVREALILKPVEETDANFATRIFGRILFETLKRPKQIFSIKLDGFYATDDNKQFFLRIPGAKAQTKRKPKLWQITSDLADEIIRYSSIPVIRDLQQRFDRLLVMPIIYDSGLSNSQMNWMKHGQVDPVLAQLRLKQWVKDNNLKSPRTNNLINLTPKRIRHTGGTTMALQGVSRDAIQDIFEHDSWETADAYIQATSSDLMPALERTSDRGVGDVFSEINNAYFFKGNIQNTNLSKKIFIPIVDKSIKQPASVGSCGSTASCNKHPLWACYTCPHFLAWTEGAHDKALAYISSEYHRWGDAEGGKERSKLGKDFDRVGAAVKEVIKQINLSKADGAV